MQARGMHEYGVRICKESDAEEDEEAKGRREVSSIWSCEAEAPEADHRVRRRCNASAAASLLHGLHRLCTACASERAQAEMGEESAGKGGERGKSQ